MINKELETKQKIFEAAEEEFLEKGYGNAKMMAIAKRAGVSHSMLHYHFQSKKNLFQMIFEQKIQTLSQRFEGINEHQLPFIEAIKFLIERQFDFFAQNPRLPLFVMNEIISNKKNFNLIIEVLGPKSLEIFEMFHKMFDDEIEKGAICTMKFTQLMMNIFSLNVSTFLVLPLFEKIIPNFSNEALKERRESNVQFIINGLKP